MPSGCLAPNEYIDLELVGSPAALVATPLLSAEYGNVFQLLPGDGVYVPGLVQAGGSAFPSSPPAGTQVGIAAGVGVEWTFRYDPASGAIHKWEFIGGGAMYAGNDLTATFSPAGGNTWQNAGTPGPDVIPTLDGVYMVSFGARINPASSGNQAQIGLSVGGVDPIDSNVAVNAQGNSISVSRQCQVTITANQRLRLMYRDAAGSGTNFFDNRFISAIPVRCS